MRLFALPALAYVQVVGPKREALKLAEEELEVTMEALRAKQGELQEVEDGLAVLQGQYDDALRKKADLETSVDNTNKKLERATTVSYGGVESKVPLQERQSPRCECAKSAALRSRQPRTITCKPDLCRELAGLHQRGT